MTETTKLERRASCQACIQGLHHVCLEEACRCRQINHGAIRPLELERMIARYFVRTTAA